MLNKRELILVVLLAFSLGVIFSDITRLKPVNAKVTNIVWEDLNDKIIVLRGDLAGLTTRVKDLESSKADTTSKLNSLVQAVKVLTTNQTEVLDNVETLEKSMNDLRTAMRLQNTINKVQ